MAHERKCILCGTEYKYCPKCSAYDGLPRWMISFDKEECRDIFDSVCKYNFNHITAAEAKLVLDKYPNADFSKYSIVTQNAIQKIKAETKQKRSRKKVDISVDSEKENIEVIKN